MRYLNLNTAKIVPYIVSTWDFNSNVSVMNFFELLSSEIEFKLCVIYNIMKTNNQSCELLFSKHTKLIEVQFSLHSERYYKIQRHIILIFFFDHFVSHVHFTLFELWMADGAHDLSREYLFCILQSFFIFIFIYRCISHKLLLFCTTYCLLFLLLLVVFAKYRFERQMRTSSLEVSHK